MYRLVSRYNRTSPRVLLWPWLHHCDWFSGLSVAHLRGHSLGLIFRTALTVSLGLYSQYWLLVHVSGFRSPLSALFCMLVCRAMFAVPYIHVNIFQVRNNSWNHQETQKYQWFLVGDQLDQLTAVLTRLSVFPAHRSGHVLSQQAAQTDPADESRGLELTPELGSGLDLWTLSDQLPRGASSLPLPVGPHVSEGEQNSSLYRSPCLMHTKIPWFMVHQTKDTHKALLQQGSLWPPFAATFWKM